MSVMIPINPRNEVKEVFVEVLAATNSEALTKKARENAEKIFAQLYVTTDLDTFSALLQVFRDFDKGKADPLEIVEKYKDKFRG